MSSNKRESTEVRTPSPTHDAVRELFRAWGLGPGAQVLGWTIESVGAFVRQDSYTAIADFARGPASATVRFRPAGTERVFARIGDVDVTHDPVDPAVGESLAQMLKQLVATLREQGSAAALVPLLERPAVEPEPDPEPEPERELAAAQPYVVVHEAPPLDPAKRAPADRPVIGFDFIELEDLERYPNALREIFEGRRGGLVIRGVYTKEEVATVVDRLQTAQEAFPRMDLPANQRSHFLGLCLELGDPTLEEYLASAARFREEIVPLFDGFTPFEERIEQVLRSLAGGRRVQLAEFRDGRAYTPATIRILPPDAQLAPHCGNEMYRRPGYEHLNSIVDGRDQLSYFLTLQEPEDGGGLIVYSLQWSSVGPDHILPDDRSNVGLLLADAEWMEVRPSPGDVLIFDGGRYLHRVDWVRGARTRWTMGGFVMFDRAGETVLYFA